MQDVLVLSSHSDSCALATTANTPESCLVSHLPEAIGKSVYDIPGSLLQWPWLHGLAAA